MADGLGTAGSIMQTVAPALGAIPVVGNIASAAFSIGGGIMQQQAAKKQAEQAANARKQAAGLQPRNIQSEYYKKLRADQMAALSGMAGLELGQQKLDAATAANLRAIKESSASGAQTVAALSAAIGQQNAAQNDLTATDLRYKADMRSQVGKDLEMIGGKKDVQQGITDTRQKEMLQYAAALENAATVNKQAAANQMLATASSTIGSVANSAPAFGQMAIDQKNWQKNKIQEKIDNGVELSDAEKAFMQKFPAEFSSQGFNANGNVSDFGYISGLGNPTISGRF